MLIFFFQSFFQCSPTQSVSVSDLHYSVRQYVGAHSISASVTTKLSRVLTVPLSMVHGCLESPSFGSHYCSFPYLGHLSAKWSGPYWVAVGGVGRMPRVNALRPKLLFSDMSLGMGLNQTGPVIFNCPVATSKLKV